MNPQFDPAQGLHLPQPAQPGQVLPSNVPSPVQPAVPAGPPAAPHPAYQPQPSAYQQPTSQQPPAPAVSEQVDQAAALLDEEWVAKAKEVVAQTSMDPYEQSRGLAHVKAQYLKARYNKDIKIGKD